ncbi:GIY-YIG nuclease family protein [Allomuricauda sp. CP2A]|jgi:putative endonuclease|uniref:GIY-YIG nuclease family protein n=1 Tax=Allomuricauda sp. CP2A TaxID=1848189 RepID=UPI0028BF075E|nr:GIY-YIG nuclease family protein [Muricauda sp. CP2A]
MAKYYVYILTNRHKTVLYTGMTNNLSRRLMEHKENIQLIKKNLCRQIQMQALALL